MTRKAQTLAGDHLRIHQSPHENAGANEYTGIRSKVRVSGPQILIWLGKKEENCWQGQDYPVEGNKSKKRKTKKFSDFTSPYKKIVEGDLWKGKIERSTHSR